MPRMYCHALRRVRTLVWIGDRGLKGSGIFTYGAFSRDNSMFMRPSLLRFKACWEQMQQVESARAQWQRADRSATESLRHSVHGN